MWRSNPAVFFAQHCVHEFGGLSPFDDSDEFIRVQAALLKLMSFSTNFELQDPLKLKTDAYNQLRFASFKMSSSFRILKQQTMPSSPRYHWHLSDPSRIRWIAVYVCSKTFPTRSFEIWIASAARIRSKKPPCTVIGFSSSCSGYRTRNILLCLGCRNMYHPADSYARQLRSVTGQLTQKALRCDPLRYTT